MHHDSSNKDGELRKPAFSSLNHIMIYVFRRKRKFLSSWNVSTRCQRPNLRVSNTWLPIPTGAIELNLIFAKKKRIFYPEKEGFRLAVVFHIWKSGSEDVEEKPAGTAWRKSKKTISGLKVLSRIYERCRWWTVELRGIVLRFKECLRDWTAGGGRSRM